MIIYLTCIFYATRSYNFSIKDRIFEPTVYFQLKDRIFLIVPWYITSIVKQNFLEDRSLLFEMSKQFMPSTTTYFYPNIMPIWNVLSMRTRTWISYMIFMQCSGFDLVLAWKKFSSHALCFWPKIIFGKTQNRTLLFLNIYSVFFHLWFALSNYITNFLSDVKLTWSDQMWQK